MGAPVACGRVGRPLNCSRQVAGLTLLREYERRVVQLLVVPHLGAAAVKTIVNEARLVSYENTGVGYFLTLAHPSIPSERMVCDKPTVSGQLGDTPCGFVIFIERGELTF